MTPEEQNAVNKLKMQVARIVIDLDDEKVLEVIRQASLKDNRSEQEKWRDGE